MVERVLALDTTESTSDEDQCNQIGKPAAMAVSWFAELRDSVLFTFNTRLSGLEGSLYCRGGHLDKRRACGWRNH